MWVGQCALGLWSVVPSVPVVGPMWLQLNASRSALQARYVPRRWGRRLRALCWTPVLMMNFLSSFTFFAGGTVGKIYAYRFLIEGSSFRSFHACGLQNCSFTLLHMVPCCFSFAGFPVTHLTVGLAFYSFVQTSMEYENYLDRRKVKAE